MENLEEQEKHYELIKSKRNCQALIQDNTCILNKQGNSSNGSTKFCFTFYKNSNY